MTELEKLEELELLNEKLYGVRYVKSYPILTNLNCSPTGVALIELILNYNDMELPLSMPYKRIGELLHISPNTVSNIVSKLKKRKYITTVRNNERNHTDMVVNQEYLIEVIDKELNKNETTITTIKDIDYNAFLNRSN